MSFTLSLLFLSLQVFANHTFPTEIKGPDLLSGKGLQISLQDKKALVVVFLSAKCPCSNSHVEELKNLKQSYSQFQFVAVHSNVDEPQDLAKSYFEKIQLPFPVIADSKAQIADQFQALKTPHVFVIFPDGHPAYKGGVSSSKKIENADRKLLREALEDLQADKKVRTPEGRTLGCVINRGEKNVW